MNIYIDGDYILYTIAARLQPKYYGVGDEWFDTKRDAVDACQELELDPTEAIVKLECMLPPYYISTYSEQAVESLNARLKAKFGMFGNDINLIWGLSDSNNFRKELDPTYKAQRVEKPFYLPYVKDFVKEYTNALQVPYMEMDDVIGQFVMQDKNDNVIVSVDKDLANLATTVYNPAKDTIKQVTNQEGFKTFLTQVITGDTVDNIKGVPGLGLVAAAQIVPAMPKGVKAKDIFATFLSNLEAFCKTKGKTLDMDRLMLDIVMLDVGGYYHKLLGLKHPDNGKYLTNCSNFVATYLKRNNNK